MERAEFRVPEELERSHRSLINEGRVEETADALLGELAAHLGRSDLAGCRLLDVGCGVKFTRAIVTDGIPVTSYVGIDVNPEVVSFLQAETAGDQRFAHHHFDVYNERYNPSGKQIDDATDFPVAPEFLDAITGYSLYTHFDPHSFAEMSRMMRAVAAPHTKLVVTAYLDEETAGGHGFIDKFSAGLGASAAGMAKGGYIDVFEDDPLYVTLYDRDYATNLWAEAGWRVVDIADPTPAGQHTVVATPI